MISIQSTTESRDSLEELKLLLEEGYKFRDSLIPLQVNWNISWIDKIMSRLGHNDILEFLDNKPNPHRKGPPADPPEAILEYLERLEKIIKRLEN
jgi:hypothetical protein